MKLYYYFSVNDRFFTEATQKLKETNTEIQFYGLAGGKRDFLDTEIYESISYLSELNYLDTTNIDYDYLRKKEIEYDFKLADLINAERAFGGLNKLQKIRYAQAIIAMIEKDYMQISFDVLFLEGIDDLPSFFLYFFAKKKQIPYYYFVYARMGDAVFLSDRLDTGPVDLNKKYQHNLNSYHTDVSRFESTKKYIKDYLENKKQPYYVSQSNMLFKIFNFSDVSLISNAFKNYYRDKKTYHAFSFGHPFLYPLLRLKKIKNKIQYKNYFKDEFLNPEELKKRKYFIYPLHFHPEAATLIQGRWFNNQKEIIEMFSKALPVDTILIVKEHKVSLGRRDLSFYKEINKLHNVHFVSENTEVYSLMKNSLGVITISSSMGLEAIMLNKAVITFGDIHYNILSQVIKARDFSEMQEYINSAIAFTNYNEDEYWAFFKTITENCYSLPGYSPHSFKPQHVETFVLMLKDINKKITN